MNKVALLTKAELLKAFGAHKTRKHARTSVPNLRDAINSLPSDTQLAIQDSAERKFQDVEASKIQSKQKRVLAQQEQRANKRQRTLDAATTTTFLQLPNSQQIKSCHAAFVEGFSNSTLKRRVRVACSRELTRTLSSGEELALDNIPHSQHLVPQTPHFAHCLTNGMLLDHVHIREADESAYGWFCADCL